MKRRPKIGLALGSGGARGMSHLGVLKSLVDWGIPIDCVAGTSIGAIMGALLISGNIDAAIDWARDLDWKETAKLFAEVNFPKTGFLTGKNIDRLLENYVSFKTFEDSPIPFATVATDITTGQEVVLSSGNLLEAVHASFSIPGVFCPVRRNGCQLVDGGLVNPLPISVCRSLGADIVIAVDINLRPGPVTSFRKSDLKLFDILTNSLKILENEVTRRVLAAEAPDFLIQPAVGSIQTLSFNQSEKAIQEGFLAAREARTDLERLLQRA